MLLGILESVASQVEFHQVANNVYAARGGKSIVYCLNLAALLNKYI